MSESQHCARCGKSAAEAELLPAPVQPLQPAGKHAVEGERLCRGCLNQTRRELITQMLGGRDEIDQLEAQVIQSIIDHKLVSVSPTEPEESVSWPDRLSDNIAKFGGSWRFIITFMLIMTGWILLNLLLGKPFDPYPFILLNLALSCLAALQAPVIMMSQNRQESRDRERNINDYQVNLKAELEIRQLHLKLDQLLYHQWQKLCAMQELQIDMLEELLEQQPEHPPATPDAPGA